MLDKTFADHYYAFYSERFGILAPEIRSPLGQQAYSLYIDWAFACFSGKTSKRLKKRQEYLNCIARFVNMIFPDRIDIRKRI